MGAAVSVTVIGRVTVVTLSGQQYINLFPLPLAGLLVTGSFDPSTTYNFTLNVSDGGVINLNGKGINFSGGFISIPLAPGSSVDTNKTYGVSNSALYFYT